MTHTIHDLLLELSNQGIAHPALLNTLRKVPRSLFVDETSQSHAYDNIALPIGHAQTISQPYIVAAMTQYLLTTPPTPRKILEIGTGSGYQAAILADLFEHVWSIERIPALHHRAKHILLHTLRLENVTLKLGDGSLGWPEVAPFDAIIVTAAANTVPPALLTQLSPQGGKLLIPVGKQNEVQKLTLILRENEHFTHHTLEKVIFVPLIVDPSHVRK